MTSVPKLEKKIKRARLPKKRELLKTLFGNTPKDRKSSIIQYCISAKLIDIIQKFDAAFLGVYGFEFSDTSTKEHKKIIKATHEDLDMILNYEGFNAGINRRGVKKWSRHEFITGLRVKVCPYCNRQYITSYEDEANGSRTTADADHYYPKAEYPILQMNIFNLIPSCSVCNSKAKGTSNKRHLYPYENPSDSLIFEIPIEAGDQVSEILINTKGSKKAEASREVFKLDKVYQAHLDEAAEVKRNAEDYFEFGDKAYEALQGLKVPFDIFSTWFSFMGKDISAEPLTKLKQDIFRQLKAELKK